MKDLFGKAIWDYHTNNNPENIITETCISEKDEMEVAYLFRDYHQMPLIEQKALELARGKILDVGCGAGSHSLYLQNKGFDVTSIDISENAVATCKLRGLNKAFVKNILDLEAAATYDTILLLMNGTGIFGTLKETKKYLTMLKSLLKPNGQIIIDSSDIIYMFDKDNDGGYWIPDNHYYGELVFTITYKKETEVPFPWLYLDYNTLHHAALDCGLQAELITEGEHYDYLAVLKLP
jgi:SAM-dependent methyltransferase